jgi:hypothetical protein
MSRDEAVAVIRAHDQAISTWPHSKGTTTDGRGWSHYHVQETPLFNDLPPAEDFTDCVLSFGTDGDYRDVEISIGPDGRVSELRITPGVLEERMETLSRNLRGAGDALASLEWWQAQPRKLERSLRRKWPWIAACLAVGLVFLGAWHPWRRPLDPEVPADLPNAPGQA